MNIDTSTIVRIIINAAHVDIDIWAKKSLRNLRSTAQGERFCFWAQSNPAAFKSLLRAASAGIGEFTSDRSQLQRSLVRTLEHLPAEIFDVVEHEGPYIVDGTFIDVAEAVASEDRDSSFKRRYEEALGGLTDERLSQVAKLSKSKLKEWVDSPRAIRPHLLSAWNDNTETKSDDIFKRLSQALEKGAEKGAESLHVKAELARETNRKRREEKNPLKRLWYWLCV